MIRFGTFELDVRQGELRRKGRRVRLQQQPLRLLCLLAQRPGELVTRQELHAALWPDTPFVEVETGLNSAVRKLRRALGDTAENPLFVETVPRRGYRFIAPRVLESDAADMADSGLRGGWWAAWGAQAVTLLGFVLVALAARYGPDRPAHAQGPPRLAVLPFVALGGGAPASRFAEGLTEELISQLGSSGRGRLVVLGRTSSRAASGRGGPSRELALRLGADYLIEGTLRTSGDRVRVDARLLLGSDGTQVWSSTFDRRLGDLFRLQEEIARAAAGEIQVAFGARPEPARRLDPTALESYLAARHELNAGSEEGTAGAIEHLRAAIRRDPGVARYHASLAEAYAALRGFYRPPREVMPLARQAARRALELDPTLAEAHAALGAVQLYYDWSPAAAESSFRRALELNPSLAAAHNGLANLLASQGRHDQAAESMRLALALDPLALPLQFDAAWLEYLARRYDAMLRTSRRLVGAAPELWMGHAAEGLALAKLARPAQALRSLERARGIEDNPFVLEVLGGAHAIAGDGEAARQVLAELERRASREYVCRYEVATIHALLGDEESAVACLRQALADRSDCIPWLPLDPQLDSLRASPRFAALVEGSRQPPRTAP